MISVNLRCTISVLVLCIFGFASAQQVSLPTCCELAVLQDGQKLCTVKSISRVNSWLVPAVHMSDKVDTNFSLYTKAISCQTTEQHQVSPISTGDEPPMFQLKRDGMLLMGDRMYGDYFNKNQYCIEGITEAGLQVRTCEPMCTKEEPCIRKCCPLDSVYDVTRRCQDSGDTKWSPKLFKTPSKPESLISDEVLAAKGIQPRIQIRPPPAFNFNCPDGKVLMFPYSEHVVDSIAEWKEDGPAESLKFRMGADGKLRLRNIYRKWKTQPDDHYCTDGIQGFTSPSLPFNNTVDETFVFLCVPVQEPEQQVSDYYGFLAIFTSFFALVTVIVYLLLFSKQNIHGWTTMAHSASVFFFFIFMGTAHLTKFSDHIHDTHGCRFIATMAHYFFLSTFCWLFMISFDLWCTFRSISAASSKQGWQRFVWYSVFGWGVPFLIVLMSWILDIVYRDNENTEIKVPMYGVSFCYITRYALWEFLYGPVAILLLLNVICFTMTAVKLYQYQQSTKMATKNMKKDRQSFIVFVKLFFVVGALWVFEVVSFSIHGAHITWYWQILDTINVLQPVAIFFIFVFKWEIINPLHEKYPVLRPVLYPARRTLSVFRSKDKKRPTSNSESAGLTSKDNNTRVSRVTSLQEENTGV